MAARTLARMGAAMSITNVEVRPRVPVWVHLDELMTELERPTPGWLDHIACAGAKPALFFPASALLAAWVDPLTVCARCPVRLCCLAAHLTEHDGCFATTPGQRTKIRAALRARGIEVQAARMDPRTLAARPVSSGAERKARQREQRRNL